LTSFGGHAGTPRWSPDSKWIAFDYRPSTHSQIFVIDDAGRNLHSITSGDYENIVPSWSRDGKAVYFASNRTGQYQVWRHELLSGRETQLTRSGGLASFESADGKTLYFSRFSGGGIWTVPSKGGEEKQITNALHRGYWGHFAVTDTGLYFVDSDAESGPAVMYYDFQAHRLSKVISLQKGYTAVPGDAGLTASADGRTVLYVQGTGKTSIVLAENLQ
jgi:Tol biopolymer transport system component